VIDAYGGNRGVYFAIILVKVCFIWWCYVVWEFDYLWYNPVPSYL
jgi:hypothetical protein